MFCPKFIRDSYQEFVEKTISEELFWNFVQTKTILYLLSAIFIWVRIALEKIIQVLSYVICI